MNAHTFRTLLPLSLLLLWALAPTGIAQPVILTFDDVAGPAGTFLTDQYASRGVTFNQPLIFDYEAGILGIPDFARSGSKAIRHCFAQEFCLVPIEMRFTAAQAQVRVWVGYSSPLASALTITLRGFDAGGAQVAEASAVLPASASPQLIRTPILITTPTASIVRATVLGRDPVAGFETIYDIAVDDVEFDTEGPPPPCSATQAPAVVLSSPANGLVTQIPQVLIGGSFTTQAEVQEATITVAGTSASHAFTILNRVPQNGGSFGPSWYAPLYPGSNTITLMVRNCFGARQASRTITYNPIDPVARISLLGLEPTQAIQDFNGTFVELIAGKRTFVRVYLRVTGSAGEIRGVRGRLFATREDGSSAGGPGTIASLNSIAVTSDADVLSRREDIDATLNFELPPEWTAAGRIHFGLSNLTVDGIPVGLPCDGCSNLLPVGGRPRTNTFHDAPPLRVVLWSVPYVHNGTTHEPRALDFDHLRSWLRRAYPTPGLELAGTVERLAAFSGVPDDDFDCDDVNARLYRTRTYCFQFACFDVVGGRTKYYGLVSDTVDFMRGCAKGIPSIVASGPAGSSSWGWDFDGSYADWYGGHELAHTYGRKHPGFCGSSDDDDDFPFPDGLLSNAFQRDFGFDVGDPALGIDPAVYPPLVFHDVMTYCDNQWISAYTYAGILSKLRDLGTGGGEGGGAGAKTVDERGGGAAGESLLVQAKLNVATQAVALQTFSLHTGVDLTERPAASDWTIDLLGAGGNRLARYPFEPLIESEPHTPAGVVAGGARGSITEVVPWVEGTGRVAILFRGAEKASRSVSASAPAPRIISPNGGEDFDGAASVQVQWEAADADGDPLVYTLLYSTNGGGSWHALRDGISGVEETVRIEDLPGSDSARFRVIANDGINTGSDDSDGDFRVPLKPPVARIIAPATGTVVARGDPVVFSGEASDREDRFLSGASLRWFSSSGRAPLGTGETIAVTGLSPGEHEITLTATDSSDAQGSDTITIEVVDTPPVADAGPDRNVLLGSTVALDGTGSTGLGTLAYEWSFASTPGGSQAAISSAGSATASFVADRVGDFLVQLDVVEPRGLTSSAVVRITSSRTIPFRRADANTSGVVDLSDAVFILDVLFRGMGAFTCPDAADSNDDGNVDLSDAVYALGYLFLGGPAPPAPFPDCGSDGTEDDLDCPGRTGCP